MSVCSGCSGGQQGTWSLRTLVQRGRCILTPKAVPVQSIGPHPRWFLATEPLGGHWEMKRAPFPNPDYGADSKSLICLYLYRKPARALKLLPQLQLSLPVLSRLGLCPYGARQQVSGLQVSGHRLTCRVAADRVFTSLRVPGSLPGSLASKHCWTCVALVPCGGAGALGTSTHCLASS